MKQHTEIQTIKVSKIQKETLKRLKSKYNINPSHFIRQAIAEKIQRDRLEMKQKKIKTPF